MGAFLRQLGVSINENAEGLLAVDTALRRARDTSSARFYED